MKNKKENKKGVSVGKVIGVGASVAALGAAAYVLFGPDGKKNRKAVKSWAVKMKGEVIEKLENAKEITEPVYHDILNKVHDKYSKLKSLDASDVKLEIEEIRKHWKHMVKGQKPKPKNKKSPTVKASKKK